MVLARAADSTINSWVVLDCDVRSASKRGIENG